MTALTYSFSSPYEPNAQILYVNVVPKYSCTNHCRFCSRTDAINGEQNIYEQKAGANLYLPRAPSVDEVVTAIETNRKRGLFRRTKEIAFVGLGEPLLQFETVRDSIKCLRDKGYSGKIRIDTNGQVKCWYHPFQFGCLELIERDPAKELRESGLDEIHISLNAISEIEYQQLCKPQYGPAFGKVCEFLRDCIKQRIKTKASFVTDFEDKEVRSRSAEEYTSFAVSLGINVKNVILRRYIKPLRPKPPRNPSLL